MKILFKLGGTLLDHAESRSNLALQLSDVARQHSLVVVHGGGKQMTQYLAEHNLESRFVNGLRVSNEAVIDAATKVIAGSVNKRLVASLIATGQSAVGLSGLDGGLTEASQLDPSLGYVGRPTRSNGQILELLLRGGYLPVIACLAADRAGTIFNVNADQMAVSCAVGFGAEKLIFLTDVAGVKDAGGKVIRHLSSTGISTLVNSGVAHGGMQAKLEAADAALQAGVAEILIAPGLHPGICSQLLAGEPLGTKVSALEEIP